jgi:hypothetical protein
MKIGIIKRVILTIATAALFIVPVSIIALQSNTTKTAEAGNYKHISNPCNHICQGYYKASEKSKSHCPVMYYSYITKSYSSCTPVSQPKPVQYNQPINNASTYYSNYSNYLTSYFNPYSYNTKPNYNTSNYSYSTDYSYNNQGNYGAYIAEPYYQIPVAQPKQDYYEVYVEQPKQNYVDIYVPEPKVDTYTTYSDVTVDTSNYTDYSVPSYDAYSVGNTVFNNHNSYEALTTDNVYSN